MAGIKQLIDAPAKRVKQLEAIVEQQSRTIDRLNCAGRKFTAARRSKTAKGSFIRVIFGDMHGMYADMAAVQAFLADVKELKPKELICVGDMIDCAGFLAEHHTIGVVPQLDYTYEQDYQAMNNFLDNLSKVSNAAPMQYIEGNHEGRIHRWVAKASLRNPGDARMLLKAHSPVSVLNLEQRGIRYIERHKTYDDLRITGTIKLDPHAVAQHGESVIGKNAAFSLLSSLGKNVFFGNTHRLCAIYGENLNEGLVAVNTGCLCELRPMYGLTKVTNWTHGYVVQVVQPGKGFLAIPVPILDGESYLSPLLKLLK